MGQKKVNLFQFNWGTALNSPFNPNTALSGVLTGAMASTNTIYSNVQDVTNFDNIGLEITWTGTPAGTLSVLGSSSGQNFYPLTFNPILTQPTGAADGYLINLKTYGFTFLALQYTNASGTGTLTAFIRTKDSN